VNRLNTEIVKALSDQDVKDKLIAQGLSPRGTSPAELGNITKDQLNRYGRLFKAANIKAD
jgi:tripartite-type tricarboxylate transporter receptor subunit TctC